MGKILKKIIKKAKQNKKKHDLDEADRLIYDAGFLHPFAWRKKRKFFGRVKDISDKYKHLNFGGIAYKNLAMVDHSRGNYKRAEDNYNVALEKFNQIKDSRQIANVKDRMKTLKEEKKGVSGKILRILRKGNLAWVFILLIGSVLFSANGLTGNVIGFKASPGLFGGILFFMGILLMYVLVKTKVNA
ncbi:hypothetical protein GOV14_04970 [Candidatus Pacearchaeota archaeon]|nr:hypothetical protein [Candidatus Pacearchaeota archaeon]